MSGTDSGAVDQALPRGDEDQRQCGGFAQGQGGGFDGQQPGVDRRVLGEGALEVADPAGESVDLVADFESGDVGTDLFDHTGEVEAEYGGQDGPGVCGLARPDLEVERVHSAGRDPHQDLARFGGGPGELFEYQGCPELFEDRCAHGPAFLPGSCA